MKKIILSTLVLFALASCKKEAEKTEDTVVDFKEKINYKPIFIQKHPLQEVSLPEVENISGHHDNDTLYVTNFFATWCGPCIREIPHFKEKIQELKDQPVKFTFIGLDSKEDWETKVKAFTEENNISKNTVLVDGENLNLEFFSTNFKQWDGGSIPFTVMRKRDKTDETLGMITEEQLNEKINSFLK